MYELIQHQRLESAASSITFSNIPQNYTDLMLLISPVFTGQNYVFVNVNGTSPNHTFRNLLNELGTVATYIQTAYSVSGFPVSPLYSQNSAIPSNSMVYFPNYTSNSAKLISADYGSEANSSTGAIGGILAGLWNNTAAITSLVLSLNSGSMGVGSSATLYGINRTSVIGRSPQAIGGSINYANGYWYHTFTSSGSFTPINNIQAEYVVVAGGGGGSRGFINTSGGGGGGGGGGYRSSIQGEVSGSGSAAENTLSLTAGTNYTVVIGAGGAGNTTTADRGTQGSASSFWTISSTGGGGGGNQSRPGGDGGSSGGSGWATAGVATGIPISGQGFSGGITTSSGSAFAGAGGGGAGGPGQSVGDTNNGGSGGAGRPTAATGAIIFLGGGGGGAGASTPGPGGLGGGATGNGSSGVENTGGGGGGNYGTSNGGAGGSGIVIVRYRG